MELAAAAGARDPPLAAVANHGVLPTGTLNVIVVVGNHDDDAAEVRAVDLHGKVTKRMQLQRPIVGPLSIHGGLLCASHCWGLTTVVDMATGAVAHVAADPRKKVNAATPYCVLGHVPATGEYKVLRIQADHLSRRWRQTCDVMTLGGGGGGRWRRRTPPPVTLRIEPGRTASGDVAVVAGLAYFLVCWAHPEDDDEADAIAVFDLATEEWKTTPAATLRGPLTSSLIAGTDADDVYRKPHLRRRHPHIGGWYCLPSLMKRFQLSRVGDSLLLVYCNIEDSLTELWFLEDDMGDGGGDDTAGRWRRRYTLQCTPFGEDFKPMVHEYFSIDAWVHQYHCPLAVLGNGRILVWVDRMSALRAYDPETNVWTDLAKLDGGSSVVGLHYGRPSMFEPLRGILRSVMKMPPSFGYFSFILVLFGFLLCLCFYASLRR